MKWTIPVLLLVGGCGFTGPPAGPPPTVPPDAIPITATDHTFAPDRLTLPAGQEVVVAMRNVGNAPHTFTIKELKVDEEAKARKTAVIRFTAPGPGEYRLICTYHESAKMTGTVTFR